MYIRYSCYGPFLFVLAIFISIISAVPTIGVQKDFGSQFKSDGYQSYSAYIEFPDTSVPSDQTKMSDAQFINLVKHAYDEMIARWAQASLPSDQCPGAMIGMESGGGMYFASSVRSPNNVDLNEFDRDIQGSIGWYQHRCMVEGMGTHRTGGRCAEINVLRLYGDINGVADSPDHPQQVYHTPPKSDTSPRVAVWGRPTDAKPNENRETFFTPCANPADDGYGCQRLASVYGLKSVSNQVPDGAGEMDWGFTTEPNPRGVCPS